MIRRDHGGDSGRSLTLAEFRTGAFFGVPTRQVVEVGTEIEI